MHHKSKSRAEHPGLEHSGDIGDGDYCRCLGCGEMFGCYPVDEQTPHVAQCPRTVR